MTDDYFATSLRNIYQKELESYLTYPFWVGLVKSERPSFYRRVAYNIFKARVWLAKKVAGYDFEEE